MGTSVDGLLDDHKAIWLPSPVKPRSKDWKVYRGKGVNDDTDSDGNAHRPTSHCTAVATSGIPGSRRLFEVNICRTAKFLSKVGANVLQHDDEANTIVEFATPMLLPIPELSRGYGSGMHRHGLVVFATNRGEITAVNARGDPMWQVYQPTTWPHSQFVETDAVPVAPTLAPMSLHRHGMPTTILVAGSAHAVILSEHGTVLDTLKLPHAPSQPLLVLDFNGDGLNDIILVTPQGIFGYAQVQHMGGYTLSSLLVTLIIAMGVIYYTQQMAGSGAPSATSSATGPSSAYGSGLSTGDSIGFELDFEFGLSTGDRRGMVSRKLRSTDCTD
eukprot:gene26249-17349_t